MIVSDSIGDSPPRQKEITMPRVSLDQIAPDFSLPDFSGDVVSFSDYRGRKNVLLVFNRGFF
jgi:peroxiredoxin